MIHLCCERFESKFRFVLVRTHIQTHLRVHLSNGDCILQFSAGIGPENLKIAEVITIFQVLPG